MREPTHPQTPSPTSEDRAQLRALAPIGVVVLAILVTFVALFLAAFHDPKPNGLEVAVVGQPALQQRLQEHVGRAGIGKLDFTRYTSPAEARAAVRDGDVQGALIVEAGRPRLLVASAGSFIVAQALEDILGRAAAANGARPAVEDVRPLPKHDSRGLSAVFVTFGTVIPSFMLGAALWMLGGAARPRVLAALIGAFAIVAGLLAALTADTVIGALDGQFWGLAGLVALLAVAVAAPVAGLGRLAGPAGIAIAVLVLMLTGQAASGGPVGYLMLPDFYKLISQLLPTGAAITALRDIVYFDGQHTLVPALVMTGWAVGGLIAVAVGRRTAPHRPTAPARERSKLIGAAA